MDAIKILVVDDKLVNLNSAKEQFRGKNVQLTCCPMFSVATKFLKRNRYDILLTDLMLPGESEGISNKNPEIGVEVPYGLVLSILAKNIGIPYVAILTDISHHAGPIAWAMDKLLGSSDYISCFNHKQWLRAAEEFVTLTDVPENTDKKEFTKKSLIIAGTNDSFKEHIKNKLTDNFDITIIEEELTSELPCIYTERMPDHIILIGEIDPRVDDSDSSVKKMFDYMKLIKTPEQKIIIAGFLESDDPCYIRLPFEFTDLEAMLND